MQPLRLVSLTGGALLLLAGASLGAHTQQRETPSTSSAAAAVAAASSGTAPIAAAPAPSHQSFAGEWVYNNTDSLNAANGRPEDGSTQRQAGSTGAATGHGGPTTGAGAVAGGPGRTGAGASSSAPGPGGFGGGSVSPWMSLVLDERRDLARDLLEVPVQLKIDVSDNAITFVDHLARALTYPTTGKKQKYQLSASIFEARAYWDGLQLKKEIEGSEGFKMRETYFLSQDGKRLFVIVRVGDPHEKDAPVIGVDRVYDRATKKSK